MIRGPFITEEQAYPLSSLLVLEGFPPKCKNGFSVPYNSLKIQVLSHCFITYYQRIVHEYHQPFQ